MATKFYLDFISPYAYLAWKNYQPLFKKLQLDVEPIPVLFAGMLNHYGNKGPAEIPSKKVHTFRHVKRVAQELGMPLSPPPTHPFNPLLSLRLAALEVEEKAELIDALFEAVWISRVGAETPEQIEKALANTSFDAKSLIERALAPANKAKLKSYTETAIAEGVFGVPTLVIEGELFWGLDSIKHVEGFVNGTDPTQSDEWKLLEDIKPSAVRPKSRS